MFPVHLPRGHNTLTKKKFIEVGGFFMGLFKESKWKWKFKAINPVDYELILSFNADDGLFMKIYDKTVIRMARAHSKKVSGDPAVIEAFDVDVKFYPLLKNYVGKPFNITRQEITAQHGFNLLKYDVVRATFTREGDVWLIKVVLQGIYTRKAS